jgi:hypothetical protein
MTPEASRLYGLYIVGLVFSLVGNLFVRVSQEAGWLAPWAEKLIAAVSVLPLLLSVVLFWRLLRSDLDEMMQKIVLEGLAFALVVYVPLAALYVNLRTAGVWTPRLDPPDILGAPALLACIGMMIARRKYA